MSGQSPSSSLPGGAGAEMTVPTTAVTRWAPHGRALTACLVAVNVGLVCLVYLYFWRVFSRKRVASSSGAGASVRSGSDASSSAPPSPPGSAQDRGERVDVASLPSFVHAGGGAGPGEEKAAECAVCIAGLRDGDECRALQRCDHRFHAACVDVWLRLHATCPLCRASVVAPATAAEPEREGGVPDTTAAVEDVHAPV